MPSESGATTSIWMTDVDMPTFAGLVEDAETDVCVVGAGISGLTTAYLLAKAGKSVLVLDHGQVGSGETGRTTAHLASAQDDRFTELERMHGQEGSRLAAESHAAAIDRIEAIVHELHIDCDFERLDGYLFLGPGHTPALLDEELEAAQRAGLHAERLDEAPVVGIETGPCLRFPRQGQIHALKYLAGLARGIVEAGGRICTGAHVEKVEGGTPCRVEVRGGLVVTAGAVVVATNSPINDRLAIHTKQAPYRTYVVGLRVPRGKVGRALYWDTLDPYHYVRLQADAFEETSEVLIVGGEDEKTGQHDDAEARLDRLEAWTREHFPAAGEVVFRWSGQVMEPVDGMAFLGRNPGDRDVYIATGDSGQGTTHGTIAGMLITDQILGRENPWESLYDPSRKSLRSLGEFARENLNVAGQYTDWATPGEVKSADEIAPGTGAVLRRGLHKIAAYRDESGVLHERSATCTHLGCVVHWNSAESIWNCPCHGGRFDPYGRVVNGPPPKDLAEVEG